MHIYIYLNILLCTYYHNNTKERQSLSEPGPRASEGNQTLTTNLENLGFGKWGLGLPLPSNYYTWRLMGVERPAGSSDDIA